MTEIRDAEEAFLRKSCLSVKETVRDRILVPVNAGKRT